MFGVEYLERMQEIVGDEKCIFKGKLDVSKKRQDNIEKLFMGQTSKEQFYNQIKKKNFDNVTITPQENAINQFFDKINKTPTMIPKPSLLMIDDNSVKFVNETISKD
tara:strand:- start:784 stop:1104 length:321 start_codon:yes stop_codon:yes gene_type:complete